MKQNIGDSLMDQPLQRLDSIEKKLLLNKAAFTAIVNEFGYDVMDMTAINENLIEALRGDHVDHIGVLTIRYAPRPGQHVTASLQLAFLVVLGNKPDQIGFIRVQHSMDELAVRLYYTFEIALDGGPTAVFIGYGEGFPAGTAIPFYNLVAPGHPQHGSTMSADSLERLGVTIPATPPFDGHFGKI